MSLGALDISTVHEAGRDPSAEVRRNIPRDDFAAGAAYVDPLESRKWRGTIKPGQKKEKPREDSSSSSPPASMIPPGIALVVAARSRRVIANVDFAQQPPHEHKNRGGKIGKNAAHPSQEAMQAYRRRAWEIGQRLRILMETSCEDPAEALSAQQEIDALLAELDEIAQLSRQLKAFIDRRVLPATQESGVRTRFRELFGEKQRLEGELALVDENHALSVLEKRRTRMRLEERLENTMGKLEALADRYQGVAHLAQELGYKTNDMEAFGKFRMRRQLRQLLARRNDVQQKEKPQPIILERLKPEVEVLKFRSERNKKIRNTDKRNLSSVQRTIDQLLRTGRRQGETFLRDFDPRKQFRQKEAEERRLEATALRDEGEKLLQLEEERNIQESAERIEGMEFQQKETQKKMEEKIWNDLEEYAWGESRSLEEKLMVALTQYDVSEQEILRMLEKEVQEAAAKEVSKIIHLMRGKLSAIHAQQCILRAKYDYFRTQDQPVDPFERFKMEAERSKFEAQQKKLCAEKDEFVAQEIPRLMLVARAQITRLVDGFVRKSIHSSQNNAVCEAAAEFSLEEKISLGDLSARRSLRKIRTARRNRMALEKGYQPWETFLRDSDPRKQFRQGKEEARRLEATALRDEGEILLLQEEKRNIEASTIRRERRECLQKQRQAEEERREEQLGAMCKRIQRSIESYTNAAVESCLGEPEAPGWLERFAQNIIRQIIDETVSVLRTIYYQQAYMAKQRDYLEGRNSTEDTEAERAELDAGSKKLDEEATRVKQKIQNLLRNAQTSITYAIASHYAISRRDSDPSSHETASTAAQ